VGFGQFFSSETEHGARDCLSKFPYVEGLRTMAGLVVGYDSLQHLHQLRVGHVLTVLGHSRRPACLHQQRASHSEILSLTRLKIPPFRSEFCP
jgi:hypothetical protein